MDSRDSASASRSRGPAFPYAILAAIRSISANRESSDLTASRTGVLSIKNSIASSLLLISSISVMGRDRRWASTRLPIVVFVRSRQEKSVEPFVSCRILSLISRLRRVIASSIRPCSDERKKRLLIWVNEDRWVSLAYESAAPAAAIAAGRSSHPYPASETTWKCSRRVFRARCSENSRSSRHETTTPLFTDFLPEVISNC